MSTASKVLLIVLVLAAGTLSTLFASDKLLEEADTHREISYIDSKLPAQDLQNALEKAKQSDKLLLAVLGAQWCHDSRGLAAQFSKPELSAIIDESYELIFIDVGYFKDLRDITHRFGQAHYFATPTVYIIDPATDILLNDRDLAMWGMADSLPYADYLEYFTRYADINIEKASSPSAKAAQVALIEEFKSAQSNRLMKAYQFLVPAMKQEDQTGVAPEHFYEHWREVREYRMKLQSDIDALYQQAEAKPNSKVDLPHYPAFSWEQE